jgi:hypothetical protein
MAPKLFLYLISVILIELGFLNGQSIINVNKLRQYQGIDFKDGDVLSY